ncbi:hypothetical protein DB88DRAFT_473332 [Papiliotrema laurentii]|uniref:Uncharacterized protein n=1 Tax=Papiliotrema laurentii TaxID=5418 RepID=A0AAD9CZN1_PAPLA|nr:hypothetical protein DB88DRAFT_473332 [Papiliotrema laurentii]
MADGKGGTPNGDPINTGTLLGLVFAGMLALALVIFIIHSWWYGKLPRQQATPCPEGQWVSLCGRPGGWRCEEGLEVGALEVWGEGRTLLSSKSYCLAAMRSISKME